jgi:hypothetical protein
MLMAVNCGVSGDGALLKEPTSDSRRSYLPFFSEAFVKENNSDLFAQYAELFAEAGMKLALELRRAPGGVPSDEERSAWLQLTCRFGLCTQ